MIPNWNQPAQRRENHTPDFSGLPISELKPKKPLGLRRWKTQIIDKEIQKTNWENAGELVVNSSHGGELTNREWAVREAARLTAASGYQNIVRCRLHAEKPTSPKQLQCCIIDTGIPVPKPTPDIWEAFASRVFGFPLPVGYEKMSEEDRGRVERLRQATYDFILWREFDGTREVLTER